MASGFEVEVLHELNLLLLPRYYSPYPLTDTELDDPDGTPATPQPHITKSPGVTRTTERSHGRTSDLLAGGMGRGRQSDLFVCEMCFKYMSDGTFYETHRVRLVILRSMLPRHSCLSRSAVQQKVRRGGKFFSGVPISYGRLTAQPTK